MMTSHIINKKRTSRIYNILQNCPFDLYCVFHQYWYSQLYEEEWGSILESFPSIPVDVLGVAPKETDYFAFECHAFDASGDGFYEIVIVDHPKKENLLVG